MTKSSLAEIRKEFLDYFSKNNHKVIQSSPLVPSNDDSLLFTNAGMVQFKDTFIGNDIPLAKKATTAQKCVRAGGKHNDLENVGLTKRHHTFFEMLGNFSFGDYFKADAIELAYNLITKNYCIDPNRLIVTVYHSDEEAFDLWKKITNFNDKKIIRISSNDNFWEMGDTGPCGPCSEIFFDHGDKLNGGLPGSDLEGDRFVEIWNLVFMQFNKRKDGVKELLPKPSIDTGMGIERVAAVLQGTPDNYEIDLFRKLIDRAKDIFSVPENNESYISLRVISDHIRSVSFLIADGVTPANDGRGYVLRRILRRAIRHIYHLGIREPKFFRLVPTICKEMGKHYKELNMYKDLITNTIEKEEVKFLETLDKGLKILDEENKKNSNTALFSGKTAFKLYDTYGFPIDLTADVLKNSNKNIDMKEFEVQMSLQKEKSKQSWRGSYETDQNLNLNKILSELRPTNFLGYEQSFSEENILKIIVENSEFYSLEDTKIQASLIFNSTPFYAEGGGQVADTGIIKNNSFLFHVVDTQKRTNNVYEHIGYLKKGKVVINTKAKLEVDFDRRKRIAAHHSATHLLHSSLRRVLGNHVSQKGSLVSETKLRFDISHPETISRDIIKEVETDINMQIINNYPVEFMNCKKEEALKMGAMAIFGEKYDNDVRVVQMGKSNNKPFSVELCGGIHVKNTGEIGLLKIISESSLASGIRRIEAVSGMLAVELFQSMEQNIHAIADSLSVASAKILDKVTKLVEEKKSLEKEIKTIKKEKNKNLNLQTKEVKLRDIKLNYIFFEDKEVRELKNLIDNLLSKKIKNIGIIIANNNNKVTIVIGVTQDLINNYNAVDLVRLATPILGGKGGGGKPTLAQGGGTKPVEANNAIRKLIKYIENKRLIS